MTLQPRIVCLCPSLTETLFSLGLGTYVVGVTSFCIHPPEARKSAKIVGGTKNPNIEAISKLAPTHVVVDTEENRASDIHQITKKLNTIPFTIKRVDQINPFLDFCQTLGGETSILRHQINTALEKAKTKVLRRWKVFYPIWFNPWMSINDSVYISDILNIAGFDNICGPLSAPYPQIEELDELPKPEIVLLPSEPFHFKKEHQESLPWHNIPIYLIDGEMPSWYGAHTPLGISYLMGLYDTLCLSK